MSQQSSMTQSQERALLRCAEEATRLSNPVILCNTMISILRDTVDYQRCAVVLRRRRTGSLLLLAHCQGDLARRNYLQEVARVQNLIADDPHGIVRRVIETGRPHVAGAVGQDPHYVEGALAVRSEACFPLLAGASCFGALNAESPRAEFFGPGDRVLLTAVAALLALHLAAAPALQALE